MRVAAIDCGTNSIRLLISEDGRDVARRMEIVRLGEGVDRTGMLAPAAIERTRRALEGYAAEIRDSGAERVRMCATSASRDASNAADFRAMVRAVLGVEPEVISGDEEARLSFAGAVQGLDAEPPYLVVDIGGGSTEFVVGSGSVEHAISMDIGCVRMTERHLHSDPPTAAEIAAAEQDVTKAVDTALRKVSGHGTATLVGLAGSVTTVAALALRLPEYDSARIHHARVSADEVAKVTSDLLGATVADRLDLPVMHPGRADVIGAGALILRIIMERARKTSVVASEHDILDGIAFSIA
ncbi:Ppx/GppA phosphatase family protein [Symbioplanes lichenis]|uniref:Ppx/GppA phosphatase family protein n=1 Tax=Symbioplanes lichenis TaxID=1629072 RepID=UPI00273A39B4|nr:Ppx/GppA phosphatase family protein [Actinoplanes lichenis]